MMNYLLKRSTTLLCKMKLAIAIPALLVTQANAQITFQSLYQRSSATGATQIGGGSSMVLSKSATSATAANNLKKILVGDNTPAVITVDHDGNIAIGYSANHFFAMPKGATDKLLYFREASSGAKIMNMALDENEEYLYLGAENQGIRRYIWKNIPGKDASIGNHLANKNVGDALPALGIGLNYIPFVPEGAQVFFNGETNRSALSITKAKGLVFDADGNLYYADAVAHRIRRINIRKTTATGTSGTNTITLTTVPAGIKAGDLVSGLGIPDKTYIASSYTGGNILTLTTDNGTTARNLTADIDNTASIAIVTGVDDIVGAGSVTTVPAAGQNVKLSFQGSGGQHPVGMAFDAAGNLYFADQMNNRILKIEKGTGISGSSQVSLVVATPTNSTAGILIKDNNLYFSDRNNNSIYKTSLTGETPQVIAGSGARLGFRASTVAGSKTVTLIHSLYTPLISKIKPGMTLRADGDIVYGTKVVSIDEANFTFEMEDNALATKTSTIGDSNAGANMIFSSEDGYTTTGIGANVNGFLDAPAGMAIFNNGSGGFDILVAENGGYNVRVLQSVNTLPVTLSGELSAKLTTWGQVDVSWATASEKNNNYFSLKRSADGINYVTINEQRTKGEQGGNYYFIDTNPQSGINYYSLSQIDRDGTVKELGIKFINVIASANSKSIIVYPNPVTSTEFIVRVSAIDTSVLSVSIRNLQGKEVFTKNVSRTTDGLYPITLDKKLSPGVYLLTINGSETQKLIVQ